MSKACVSYNIVGKVKDNNSNILANINEVDYMVLKAIDELDNEFNSKINVYNNLLAKLGDSSIKASDKLESYSRKLTSAKAQASSTPKTITEKTTDSEGNIVTKSVNNPAYAAAQNNLQNSQQNVSAATNTLNNINSYKNNIEAKLQNLNNLKRNLIAIQDSFKKQLNSLNVYVESASRNLDKILNIINNYINKNI